MAWFPMATLKLFDVQDNFKTQALGDFANVYNREQGS